MLNVLAILLFPWLLFIGSVTCSITATSIAELDFIILLVGSSIAISAFALDQIKPSSPSIAISVFASDCLNPSFCGSIESSVYVAEPYVPVVTVSSTATSANIWAPNHASPRGSI